MEVQNNNRPAPSASNYVKSYAFETYIIFARLCNTDEFGAHNSYMYNLMDKEDGKNYAPYSLNKHLSTVKKYMLSATKFAAKRKMDKPDKEVVTSYINRIEQSTTSKELLEICEEGIEILDKYKTW